MNDQHQSDDSAPYGPAYLAEDIFEIIGPDTPVFDCKDGLVSWEGSLYAVHWKRVDAKVQVGEHQGTVGIRARDERFAVHARAQQPKQRFILPSQSSSPPKGDNQPHKEAITVEIPVGEAEHPSLDVQELVAGSTA